MADSDLLLFGSNIPGVYRLSDIYRYNADGSTVDQSQTGSVVPAEDSVIIDDTLGGGNIKLYVVTSVDNSGDDPTYEAYLEEVSNNVQDSHHIDNFGNSLQLLYYEVNGYTVDGTDFHRLLVDRKISVAASDAAYYTLTDLNGNIVSIQYDDLPSSGDGHVPMVSTGDNNIYTFEDAAADPDQFDPANGDIVVLHVYDSTDTEITSLKLLCRAAGAVGELTRADNVLTSIRLTRNDSEIDGELELSSGSNPQNLVDNDELGIKLIYGDGTTSTRSIRDDDNCFVYGLDDIMTDSEYEGNIYYIVAKYFMSSDQTAPNSNDIVSEHFLAVEQIVRIVA